MHISPTMVTDWDPTYTNPTLSFSSAFANEKGSVSNIRNATDKILNSLINYILSFLMIFNIEHNNSNNPIYNWALGEGLEPSR